MAVARNEEREFRLRPRKPATSASRRETRAWSKAFKLLIHQARNTRTKKASARLTAPHRKAFHQRCAVRVTYSTNVVKGQWRAHGRYLERDSAMERDQHRSSGFDANQDGVHTAAVLDGWQRAGDERLWKLIVSPEFGERLDLPKLTRDFMREIAARLKTDLEWTAVSHYNTEHPHVHIALRGVDTSGQPLRLDRELIRNGMRAVAEDFCTRQIGHRTERDAEEAMAREVREQRYTSLDRGIQRMKTAEPSNGPAFEVVVPDGASGGMRTRYIAERLMFLEKTALATRLNAGSWAVRNDFETVLRAMQDAHDRQRTIAAHGAMISDPRLPFTTLDLKHLKSVEGRVLVHGEREDGRAAGKQYFLLEGTDARVYYVPYCPEIDDARHQGKLKTNSFVRLRKFFLAGKPSLEVEDFGAAEALLTNKRHMNEVARTLMLRRIVPAEDGWNGWLGRYQAALKHTVLETMTRDQTLPRR